MDLINTNANTFLGTVSINNSSTLNVDSANLLNTATIVDIVTGSDTLNINNNGNFVFDNQLIGTGVMNVTTNNNQFSFGTNIGNGFTGTVNLFNTQFLLSGDNTTGNTRTTLNLDTGSTTTVGTGTQSIGAITFNGGTLTYDQIIDNNGQLTAAGTINATSINTTGGGTVSVALPENVQPDITGIGLLSLDTGAIVVDLIQGTATGTGQELTLTDGTNTPITSTYKQGILNPNSTTVAATGTFGFGLTTGEALDGLYVNYGLSVLDLLTTANDALVLTGALADNGTAANELTAQVIGTGDLAVNSPNDGSIVVLSNDTNSYTGATLVRSGILQLGSNSALGNTGNLSISNGATVDLSTYTQSVGTLNTEANALLDMGEGTLTVGNGGLSNGMLTGKGGLVLTGGILTLTSNSPDYRGITDINAGATTLLKETKALGIGAIIVDGTLNLDDAVGSLYNPLSGSGNTLLTNNSDVLLMNDNSNYNGTFTLESDNAMTATEAKNFGAASVNNNGNLILSNTSYWNLTTPISGTGVVTKHGNGMVYIGSSTVTANATVVQAGSLIIGTEPTVKPQVVEQTAMPMAFATVAAFSAEPALMRAALPAASGPVVLNSDVFVQTYGTFGGDGTITGNLTNEGNVLVGRSASGIDYGTLTVNGDYIGQGGNLTFDSVLAGDNSPTDKLVIAGDTSGTGTVTVNNIGGQGAQNTNGIEIISVGGASAATFTLNGRAVAGALEYFLYQGTTADPTNGNWYLRSNYVQPTYRPEAGGYIANIAAANTLFNSRLEDMSASSAANGTDDMDTSMWLRQSASRNKFKDASGQLSNTSSRFVTQLGGEVWNGQLTDKDYVGVGVMAGYARSTGTTDATSLTYKADNSLTGYSIGVYGTWYQNAVKHNSPYVHTWLQYEWFEGSVNGDLLSSEKYHLRGVSMSVEGGYPFQVYQVADNSGYITPEAQFTLNGAKMSDLTEDNGTLVQQSGQNNLQTRLGAKFSNDTQLGADKAHPQILTSYLELNWIHNTRLAGVTMDGMGMQQTGSRHLVEVKLGVEGKVNNNLSVWGNLTNQIGQQSYDDKAVMLGVRYKF
ncbi:MAG: autotransporter outer membrane beta-barrel domain-containing protein [Chania sp.]